MNKRETIRAIIARKPAERTGLWLGQPHAETWPRLHAYFGTTTEEELRLKLGDDVRWICPQFFPHVYQHPDGRALFDAGPGTDPRSGFGALAGFETVEQVNAYPWPNPDYLYFDGCIDALQAAGDVYRLSGFWTCFYHHLMDMFGMEEYLVKMYTHPEVVHAATDRICEFYHEANERFFAAAGDEVDGFFFGNDFGTQRDVICGPEQFDAFILPWFVRFTEQGHRHNHQVVLHSCGAIHKVIDRLIDAGVDCLHPIQALAANMDAATLARDFGGKIAFMGGVDTQELLVNGTPEQVRRDVRRVRGLLGPNLIISPSHEAVLPNVPPENIEALAAAALE